MLERLRRVPFLLVRRVLGALTAPVPRGVEQLDKTLPVCYVLGTRSLTDLVMLDIVTRQQRLPGPMEPLMESGLFGERRYFFLNRGAGAFGRQSVRTYSERLARLGESIRAARGADVCLVPVSIFWSRAPNKEKSLIRVLLSENWTVTSRMRRLAVLLFNRRDITVLFGTPIPLHEPAEPGVAENRLVRRIARLLRVQFRNHRTALLGPDLSHRRTLAARIVSSRAVREAIVAESERTERSIESVRRLAERHANAMASDMSYVTIRFLDRVLTWFWNRIYEGVEVERIDHVKDAAQTCTLVYVPSHRSHIDYLLLSYLLYHHGLAIPHIAAGDNLNMPVIGAVLRRGGAFFMRRSFLGDRLYTAVFTEYLYQMFRRGSPVEYFIEGGRSRTGRLLPPRTGLLAMTIDIHRRGIDRPIAFVPVYIGYERLIEGSSYLDELRGAEKKRESPLDVIRNLRVIRESFGRVYVGFGEPLRLAAYLAHTPAEPESATLARTLLQRINASAVVNPINLVALVLLSTAKQALDEALLVEQIDCYRRLLEAERPHGGCAVAQTSGAACIAHAEALGMLVVESHTFGRVVGLDPTNAVLMTWYRNNTQHVLALPSLIACLVANRRRRVDRATLGRMIAIVFPFLESELFIARDGRLDDALDRWLGHLGTAGLVVQSPSGELSAPQVDSAEHFRLGLLAGIVAQMLERFYIVIGLLHQVGPHRIARDALEALCQQVARRMARIYGINSPEFFDARLFHNFVDTLIEAGAASEDDDGRLVYDSIVDEVVRAAERVIPAEYRQAVLRSPVQLVATEGDQPPHEAGR